MLIWTLSSLDYPLQSVKLLPILMEVSSVVELVMVLV